ncbi:MAG: GAF domain-containing protein, partial [Pseudomonadota bacterium]
VGDTLRSTLDLESILTYLLKEISEALRETEQNPPCSIMLLDKNQGLRLAAALGVSHKRHRDFDVAARLALEKRAPQVFQGTNQHGPTTSYPIIVQWPQRGEEVVGIINLGLIPHDLEFFKDLANHAALGIVNAKLYHELELSKMALETRVNQLKTLSLMGMALQRNALSYDDFQGENNKLLARCLARIGFDRVLVYEYDPPKRLLHSGVDNSLRGVTAPPEVSLAKIDDDSQIMRTLFLEGLQYPPFHILPARRERTPAENRLLETLGVADGQAALARLVENNATRGLVFASKPGLTLEDGEALSMFVLHAGMIMEHLNLTRKFQDKTQRMTLIHEIGLSFSLADSFEAREEAAQKALAGLTQVLRASEISVYTYADSTRTLELLANTSVTAGPGRKPAPMINLKHSRIMGEVVLTALGTGGTRPLILNDLTAKLGHRCKKRFHTRSYLGVPIFGGGNLLGIMNVTDKLDGSEFTQDDAELAQITAVLLAAVLQNITLLRRVEEQTLDAVRSVVQTAEAGPFQLRRGRTRKKAETAADLARVMGISDKEAERVGHLVWLKEFSHIEQHSRPSLSGLQSAGLPSWVNQWLPLLEWPVPAGVREAAPPYRISPRVASSADLPQRIIPVAEFFVSGYLGLRASRRPKLDRFLLDVLADTAADLDREVVAALLRGLIRGDIRNGQRRVKLEPQALNRLKREVSAGSLKALP